MGNEECAVPKFSTCMSSFFNRIGKSSEDLLDGLFSCKSLDCVIDG